MKFDLWRHRGLVWREAMKRWRGLTIEQRRTVDVEDLFGEGMVRLLARQHEYDPKRTMESTWVAMVAASAIADYCKGMNRQKRVGLSVDVNAVEALFPVMEKNFAHEHALNRVERFMELATPETRRFVQTIMRTGKKGKLKVPRNMYWAIERSQVSVADLMLCQAVF